MKTLTALNEKKKMMLWYCMMRIKAAAMESDGMSARDPAGARDSVLPGQKTLIQQLLSFPQPFTITRPKVYKSLPSKSPKVRGSSKAVPFVFFMYSCVLLD